MRLLPGLCLAPTHPSLRPARRCGGLRLRWASSAMTVTGRTMTAATTGSASSTRWWASFQAPRPATEALQTTTPAEVAPSHAPPRARRLRRLAAAAGRKTTAGVMRTTSSTATATAVLAFCTTRSWWHATCNVRVRNSGRCCTECCGGSKPRSLCGSPSSPRCFWWYVCRPSLCCASLPLVGWR